MLTRRDTARLILASAAATALPIRARAASAEEWQAAMEQALAAATQPGAGTALSLVEFRFGQSGGWTAMSATVQMTWPPGLRKRRFAFSMESERDAFSAVVEALVSEFQRVNPGGIRDVRLR